MEDAPLRRVGPSVHNRNTPKFGDLEGVPPGAYKLNMTRCGGRSSRTTLADTSSVVDRLSGRNHGVFRVRGTPTACMGIRGSPSSGKAQIVYLYTTPFHREYARHFQGKVD